LRNIVGNKGGLGGHVSYACDEILYLLAGLGLTLLRIGNLHREGIRHRE